MIVSDLSKAGSATGQRRRSAIACRACRQRKVRCDISIRLVACTNCLHDGNECEVMPRKRKRNQNVDGHTRLSLLNTPPPSEIELVIHGSEPEASLERPGMIVRDCFRKDDLNDSLNQTFRIPSIPASTPNGAIAYKGSPISVEDEGENSEAFADALRRSTGESLTPFYVGDAQVTGFVFDMFRRNPDTPAGTTHFLVPHAKASQHHPEDLAYLRMKGALSMPSSDVCDDLIRLYFHHVHAFLPVIDADSFLSRYIASGLQKVNLLLLWSMFCAASNFAGEDLLCRAGYPSRKAMKRSLFRKAKVFYDMDWEDDKIALIQSTILMSLWYSDTEDRIGCWHWIGIAIGLAQSLGFHRDSGSAAASRGVHIGQTWLWRRIWWTCILRDRWLALGLGRPMRINMEDCDSAMPSRADMLIDFNKLQESTEPRYIPRDFPRIAEYWILMLKLSTSLGTILTMNYTPVEKKVTVFEIEACDRKLKEVFDSSVALGGDGSQVSQFQTSQLQLFYEAALIALYRPYTLRSPVSLTGDTASWQVETQKKIKAGAARINAVLETIIDMEMVNVLVPMSVTAIVPAMLTHLKEMSSSKSLAFSLGKNKLDICMLVMGELRKTYWGADFAYKFFWHAQGLEFVDESVPSSQHEHVRISTQPENCTTHLSCQKSSQHDDHAAVHASQAIGADNIDSFGILSGSFGILPAVDFDADFDVDENSLLSTAEFDAFYSDIWNPQYPRNLAAN